MSPQNKKTFLQGRLSPLLLAFHSSLNAFKASLSLVNLTILSDYQNSLSCEQTLSLWDKHLDIYKNTITQTFESQRLFLKGVQVYETAPRSLTPKMPPPLWTKGSAGLFDFGVKYSVTKRAVPVLFIPSLINRSYIFDLYEEKGFFAFLARHNIRPYLFDWGDQEKDKQTLSLENYLKNRLLPALHFLVQHTKKPVHIAGYCMGGLFATALRSLAPGLARSLSLFATPWDFHQGNATPLMMQNIADWIKGTLPKDQRIPGDFLQLFFHALSPFSIQKKFQDLGLCHQKKSLLPPSYIALEDWLNDTVSLSSHVFHECCTKWYQQNEPYHREIVAGVNLQKEKTSSPAYLVTPTKDRLVPLKAAQGILSLMPHADVLAPPTGHVGIFGSRRASEMVWQPYCAWLKHLH